MKKLFPVFVIFILIATANKSFGQLPDPDSHRDQWNQWAYLIGAWKGEGDGKPGQGKGSFSFLPDLDGKVLVRKNHSEYPASTGKQAIIHDDLMIVYVEGSGAAAKAIYFDNEGHVINYAVSYLESEIVLVSDVIQNLPRFRLTYHEIDKKTLHVKFEIASPSNANDFKTYLEGRCAKEP